MIKVFWQIPLYALAMLAHVCEGAEHEEPPQSPLQTLLSLGMAIRDTKPDKVVLGYRESLLSDRAATIDLLLDQFYQRKAKTAELSTVYELIAELDSDDFASRESAKKSLTRLGLPIDLLLQSLMDRASPESVTRLTEVRNEIGQIPFDRVTLLNLAAKDLLDQMPIESLRDIARQKWERISSATQTLRMVDAPDGYWEPAINSNRFEERIHSVDWIGARILGSLRTSPDEKDLELFASALIHSARENPSLSNKLFNYIYGKTPYMDRSVDWPNYDFAPLALVIIQIRDIPDDLWRRALSFPGKYERIDEPEPSINEDPFDELDGDRSYASYNLSQQAAKVVKRLLKTATGDRKHYLRGMLLGSSRDAPSIVAEMLDELRVTNELTVFSSHVNQLTNPVDSTWGDEVVKVFSDRMNDKISSTKMKTGMLFRAKDLTTPEEFVHFALPLLSSEDEKLRKDAESLIVRRGSDRVSARTLKMLAEVASIAESNPTETTREAAASLLTRWRAGVIDSYLQVVDAAIAKQVILEKDVSLTGLPSCLSARTLDILAIRLINCPPEKLAPYWKKLLSFDDARREAALYGILQQPPSKTLFPLAREISNHCIESEYARSIVRKWTVDDPDGHPFYELAKSHPNAFVRARLDEIISGAGE